MEFNKLQVATLVLGYLKNEKCYKAYKSFLSSCDYFKDIRYDIKRKKFPITRVDGLTLYDYLNQYAEIYTIVQGSLEATNYYNESFAKFDKAALVKQILYLLEKGTNPPTTDFNTGRSDSSSSCTDELDTTKDYTGNDKQKVLDNSGDIESDKNVDMSEVLAQTLLENKELHEKLAETINSVRNTNDDKIVETPIILTSTALNDEKIHAGVSRELDDIIKTVMQKTESDPLYNKLIQEIIGTTSPQLNNNKNVINNTDDIYENPFYSQTNNDNNLNQNNSTNILPQANDNFGFESDENDHISCKKSNSECSTTISTNTISTSNHLQSITTNDNGGVYLFDGNLDSYLKNSTKTNSVTTITTAVTAANPVYISSNGVIVMPSAITTNNQLATTTMQYDEFTKQYYIVNSQPLIPQTTTQLNENDIMTMPTIILNDDNQSSKNINNNNNGGTKNCTNQIVIQNSTNKINKTPHLMFKNKTSTPTSTTITATTEQMKNIITTPTSSSSTQSHVRNLDFSIPLKNETNTKFVDIEKEVKTTTNRIIKTKEINQTTNVRAWDADLRQYTTTNIDKNKESTSIKNSPPKRTLRTLRSSTNKKSKAKTKTTTRRRTRISKKKSAIIEAALKTPEKLITRSKTISTIIKGRGKRRKIVSNNKETTQKIDDNGKFNDNDDKNKVDKLISGGLEDDKKINLNDDLYNDSLITFQNGIPPTPGCNLTPFTKQTLDSNLLDVDILHLPTPKLPITPSFGSTISKEILNQQQTYSNSSSYYQPSDNEQVNKLIVDDLNTKLNEKSSNILTNFNTNIIARKDINLIRKKTNTTSESSDDNENSNSSDSSSSCCCSNCSDTNCSCTTDLNNSTVIQNKNDNEINNIIQSVNMNVNENIKTITTTTNNVKSNKEVMEETRKRTLRKISEESKIINNNNQGKLKQKKELMPKIRKTRNTVAKNKNIVSYSTRKRFNDLQKLELDLNNKQQQRNLEGGEEQLQTIIERNEKNKNTEKEQEQQKVVEKNEQTNEAEKDQQEQTMVERNGNSQELEKEQQQTIVKRNEEVEKEIQQQQKEEEKVEENVKFDSDDNIKTVEFDNLLIVEEIQINFDESSKVNRKLSDYNLNVLDKNLSANVYIEHLDIEVVRDIICTPFNLLIDLPEQQQKIERRNSGVLSSNDSKISKEKKCKDCLAKGMKKCKCIFETYNCQELLKNVDMDKFLNKVHGPDT